MTSGTSASATTGTTARPRPTRARGSTPAGRSISSSWPRTSGRTPASGPGRCSTIALCGEEERFLCFLEVKSGEFDDPTQAAMHLAVARQSEWKELHYYTPDGTDAEFSQRTSDVLAQAKDVRVVFHPVDDAAGFDKSVAELGERVAAARGPD